MATISPNGNDPNDGDKNPGEQKPTAPLPQDVKETLKKRRRLTEISRQPCSAREYAEIIGDILRNKQNDEQRESEETDAERQQAAALAELEKMWKKLMRMMQVRNDVMSSIGVILSFIDDNADDMEGVPVAEIRACLSKLREYVEKKNKEDDAHQKKITDYFEAEE